MSQLGIVLRVEESSLVMACGMLPSPGRIDRIETHEMTREIREMLKHVETRLPQTSRAGISMWLAGWHSGQWKSVDISGPRMT